MKVLKELDPFDAAHRIPSHAGKCRNLHGHTYIVTIEVDGDLDPATGMVVDFGHLKASMRDAWAILDHTHLNENTGLPEWLRELPTAENLAMWIHELVSFRLEEMGALVRQLRIHVREGARNTVVYP